MASPDVEPLVTHSEKAYSRSSDLKKHEKKHGVPNSTKQRVVQRAMSTRSRGGRNTQVATPSSIGPSVLAPIHQPIFHPSFEYSDLSHWVNRGLSSSTMGPLAVSSTPTAASTTIDVQYWMDHIPEGLDLKGSVVKGDRICSGEGPYSEVFKGTMGTAGGGTLVRIIFFQSCFRSLV